MRHQTFEEQTLDVLYSNQVWQCEHTKLDILLVSNGKSGACTPYLTMITDSYSRCIMGIHLSFDAPSSQAITLALRHAILPKQYGAEYKLHCEWGTYGVPENLVADSGKDFGSENLKQIALQLGFKCHVNNILSRNVIGERIFRIINSAFLFNLPGYLGSNIQEYVSTSEEKVYLTLQELRLGLVRYIVDVYNQQYDARTQNQTRFQKWEAGLSTPLVMLSEQDLDICLMN